MQKSKGPKTLSQSEYHFCNSNTPPKVSSPTISTFPKFWVPKLQNWSEFPKFGGNQQISPKKEKIKKNWAKLKEDLGELFPSMIVQWKFIPKMEE